MPIDFAKIDRIGCRSFSLTPVRVFDVSTQYNYIGRSFKVPIDQMNPKLYISIITDEKLGKTLNIYLGYFWLLGIVQESIIPMEL